MPGLASTGALTMIRASMAPAGTWGTSTNTNLFRQGEALFYKPPIAPDFEFTPFVYLGILSVFIILSLCLVAFFQRRKDIVR